MERPLEITFHNLPNSESLKEEIRRRVEKLEIRYGRLTACRVAVEALHHQHQTGNLYEVHVVMSVPGRELAVSREPHKPKQRYARPDVRSSMRAAFQAAERQLQAFKGHLVEDTSSPSGSAVAGRIAQMFPDRDHGFITGHTGSQVYFHRDSVTNSRFEELEVGDLVHYVEEEGDAGPVAAKVRLGTGHES